MSTSTRARHYLKNSCKYAKNVGNFYPVCGNLKVIDSVHKLNIRELHKISLCLLLIN